MDCLSLLVLLLKLLYAHSPLSQVSWNSGSIRHKIDSLRISVNNSSYTSSGLLLLIDGLKYFFYVQVSTAVFCFRNVCTTTRFFASWVNGSLLPLLSERCESLISSEAFHLLLHIYVMVLFFESTCEFTYLCSLHLNRSAY